MQNPDVRGRFTPLGNVVVGIDRDTERVTVSLRKRDGMSIRHVISESDDEFTVKFWKGRKVPRLHDEVMVGDIDKTTIEVVGVAQDPNGTIWLTGDNGMRYRWE